MAFIFVKFRLRLKEMNSVVDESTTETVFLKMEVKNAPIISDFADGIKIRGYAKDELLLLQGRKFEIEYVRPKGICYEIKLIEK